MAKRARGKHGKTMFQEISTRNAWGASKMIVMFYDSKNLSRLPKYFSLRFAETTEKLSFVFWIRINFQNI